jgi:hypothetical protein
MVTGRGSRKRRPADADREHAKIPQLMARGAGIPEHRREMRRAGAANARKLPRTSGANELFTSQSKALVKGLSIQAYQLAKYMCISSGSRPCRRFGVV